MNHLIYAYLHHFVADRITRALVALGNLGLVIPRCRTDQFSRSFLSAGVRLWNLLTSGIFSGCTLSFLRAQ